MADKEFGIQPIMTGQRMAECDVPDQYAMVSYLSQFYEYFRKESIRPAKSKHCQVLSPSLVYFNCIGTVLISTIE